MKYEDRKLCGLINLHSITNRYRCPLKEDKAIKGTACYGCALFETYLEFKEKSMELLKEKKNDNTRTNTDY